MSIRLSIIIPCYNERATLETLVERVLAAPPQDADKELVIVDDGSTDGSVDVLRRLAQQRPEVKAVFHERNRGKGAAIRTAQQECTGDIVIIQDADLEYSPENYPSLLAPILSGRADVVYGSRFAGGRARRVLLFWHEVGNRLLTLLSNLTTNLNLTDMETCYKVFRGGHFRGIPINSDRFGFEPEITAKVAKLDLRVYEVPIDYHGRTYAAGKKIGWVDGVSAVATILRYWLTDGLSGLDEGLETLQSMRHARRYNRWVFDRISPFIGDRILEAGAGIGNITANLLDRELVVAADANQQYIERLSHCFANNPNVRAWQMDLTDPQAYRELRDHLLDTVLCVNVLEHLEPDQLVLRSFFETLAPGGRAIILVPQGRWLYGSMDRALGHVRRYAPAELEEKMKAAGFAVEDVFGLNRLASLGWFVNGRILRRRSVPNGQVKLFDLMMFLVRMLDRLLPLPPLSIVGVGRKDANG